MSGKRCEPCRGTGLTHCSDPEHCGGPWDRDAEIIRLRAEVERLSKPDCRVCQYSYRNSCACTQSPNCVNGNKFVRMSDVFTPLWRTE